MTERDDRVLLGDHCLDTPSKVHEDKGDWPLIVWLDNAFFVFAYEGE